jgi:hypothetical protein
VEPAGDAMDRLDALARAVSSADELLRNGLERDAVVRTLLDRLRDWPEDMPLAGVR